MHARSPSSGAASGPRGGACASPPDRRGLPTGPPRTDGLERSRNGTENLGEPAFAVCGAARASGVCFARENNGRMRILTPEEETGLLAHCGPQLWPLVITAFRTGFRILELLLLTWEDVDFRSRVVTVRTVYVKNGKSRSVPMNEVLTTTLQAVRMSIAADGLVFRTRTVTLYRSSRTAFTHAVHQAGMMDFTLP
jgi:integrase